MCAMCGCGKEAFMGVDLAPQSMYDVGATGIVLQPEMFGTDSMDTLGTETTEEGYLHESSEPKGPMGEDID
jgi:hypothetical protein